MKNGKNKCDYIQARNENLRRALIQCMQGGGKSVIQLFEAMSQVPADRYYISEERAYSLINEKRRQSPLWRGKMVPSRRRMVEDIESVAIRLMEADPSLSLRDAVAQAVNSPAPNFYLTPNSIRTLLYRSLHSTVPRPTSSLSA